MVALSWITAHGGVAGAIVEALVALAVVLVLAAVWMRERRSRRSDALRDDEDA